MFYSLGSYVADASEANNRRMPRPAALMLVRGSHDLSEAVDGAFYGHLDEVIFRVAIAEGGARLVSLGELALERFRDSSHGPR